MRRSPLYETVHAAVHLVHEPGQAFAGEIAGLHFHVIPQRIVGFRPSPDLGEYAAQLRHSAGLAARGQLPRIAGAKYLLQNCRLLLPSAQWVSCRLNREVGPDMCRGDATSCSSSNKSFACRATLPPAIRQGGSSSTACMQHKQSRGAFERTKILGFADKSNMQYPARPAAASYPSCSRIQRSRDLYS